MARYIDADKLFRYVDEQTHLSKGKLQNYIRENVIADVAEVKHGEWVSTPIKEKGYDSKSIPTCTICGYQSFITYTYCPECGAKMDGRRDT